jgi:transposase InsO family protein
MSWKTTNPQEARERFILEHEEGGYGVAELARRHGISRKTAYKWVERFAAQGWEGLRELSRAPRHSPQAVEEEVIERVLELKARWPRWGAPKVLMKLMREVGPERCPSESSVGRILQRHGLTKGRGRARRRAQGTSLGSYHEANAVWCADFKGWFRTGDGAKCTPLTISDGYSRYLLRCQGLAAGTDSLVVKPIFEATMREYGMPEAMRTDNGPPFASVGLGGLTELSIWWLQLGLRLERIRPGCPQENGRHERMHRTLQEETAQPPAAHGRGQQRAFDRFRREYNEERPHEALGGATPSEHYAPSPRSFPDRLPEVNYDEGWETRSVRASGQIKLGGKDVQVTKALVGQRVGLKPRADGVWEVFFATHSLGLLDERRGRLEALKPDPGASPGQTGLAAR